MSVLINIAENFVNIRGSFKLGLVDLGTHSSLVKLSSGKYVLLDSLTMTVEVKSQVDAMTDGGKEIEVCRRPLT